jgi:hypothetical protein
MWRTLGDTLSSGCHYYYTESVCRAWEVPRALRVKDQETHKFIKNTENDYFYNNVELLETAYLNDL